MPNLATKLLLLHLIVLQYRADPDTAAAFKSYPVFAEEATLAETPDLYDPNFDNLQAASDA